MDVAVGLLAVGIALFSLVTTLIPRWRMTIRRKGYRARTGVISCLQYL